MTSSGKTKGSTKRHFVLLDLPKVDNHTEHQKLLANARAIEDINAVSYPEGVVAPIPALNHNVREGKFRYDRDFLLQFMSICSDKPASLLPLDVLGLRPASSTATKAGTGFPTTLSSGSVGSPDHFMGDSSNAGSLSSFGTGASGSSPTVSGTFAHTETRSGPQFPTDSTTDSMPLHRFAGTRRCEKKKKKGRHSSDRPERVDYEVTQSLATSPASPILHVNPQLNPVAPAFVPKRNIKLVNQDGEEVKSTVKHTER